jgi:hypothetical protein
MKYLPMDRFDQKDDLYQELLNMFPAFSNLIHVKVEDIDKNAFEDGCSPIRDFLDCDKKRIVLCFWRISWKDKELEPYLGKFIIDIKNWTSFTIMRSDGEDEENNLIENICAVNRTQEYVILMGEKTDKSTLIWIFDHAELHCYVELESIPESPRLAHLAQEVFNDPKLVSFFPTFEDPFIVIDPHEVDSSPFVSIAGGQKYVDWDRKRIVFISGGLCLKNKGLSRQLGEEAILDIKNWSGLKLVTTRKSSYDVEGESWTLEDLEILKEEEVLREDQLKGMNKAEVFTYDEKQLILSHRLKGEFNSIVPKNEGGCTLHWIFSNPEVGVYATLKDHKDQVTKE